MAVSPSVSKLLGFENFLDLLLIAFPSSESTKPISDTGRAKAAQGIPRTRLFR